MDDIVILTAIDMLKTLKQMWPLLRPYLYDDGFSDL